MVKSVLGVNHRGLSDWFAQRVTAIVMAVYVVGLTIFLMMHNALTYDDWHGLFSHLWMKVATGLVSLSLLYHAWIGIWTVFTDYIKASWLRMILNVLVILVLIALFLETLVILWSV